MPTEVRTAPSLVDVLPFLHFDNGKPVFPCVFRRHHLNIDVVTGWVGDRGDGKSTSAGEQALLDYMVEGYTCWSNLLIKMSFKIDDDLLVNGIPLKTWGIKGGVVTLQSKPLDVDRFLSHDPEYQNGVVVIDEINVALADARRSSSNQNLAATDVGQQLRKSKTALIYTTIHEMFVDTRIRDITDVFVLTKDTALSPEGLYNRKKPGIDFHWHIYPMSRKLTGHSYSENHQVIGPVNFHAKPFWGLIDTYLQQVRQKHYIDFSGKAESEIDGTIADTKRDPKTLKALDEWGWLYEKMVELHDTGADYIEAKDLWQFLELEYRRISPFTVGKHLDAMGIGKRARGGGYEYIINNFDLQKLDTNRDRKLVLVS